jgi:hypothetical protein
MRPYRFVRDHTRGEAQDKLVELQSREHQASPDRIWRVAEYFDI